MFCRPYVLRWIDGLCYWVVLSNDGAHCMFQSSVGFPTEEQAKADIAW
jgi:hypothetical protein